MPLPEFKQLVDEAKSQIEEITADDLKRMQRSGEDFALIDVLEYTPAYEACIDLIQDALAC